MSEASTRLSSDCRSAILLSQAPGLHNGAMSTDASARPASWVQRNWWWALDYLYAARQQMAILAPPWTVGRPRPAPSHWQRGSAELPEVVLLPGVYEHWTFLRPLGDALSAAGHQVRVMHGLGINRRTIDETAERLALTLAAMPIPAAGRVLVAHSKGGLVGKRLLLSSTALAESASAGLLGLVAVCTPFQGSRLARLMVDPSIREFLPTGTAIVSLGRETSVNGRIVSIFGRFDPHIPDGSVLDGAANVAVPGVGHFLVLAHAATHRAVIDAIASLVRMTGHV